MTRQKIRNILNDSKLILEEIHKTFPCVVADPIVVGTSKNYLNGCELIPHDIDLIVSITPNDHTVASMQSKLDRIFKKSELSDNFPIQIHTTNVESVDWMTMRMTPPNNHRGYVLGSFLAALGYETNIFFGYTGAFHKKNGITTLVTLNPNFAKDIILFNSCLLADCTWTTNSIDDLWKNSIKIIKACNGNVERFHNTLMKNLSKYESNDESYIYSYTILNNLLRDYNENK